MALARRGLGRVWPNPAVGCVIVRDGRIVGRGRTADGGRPHAEVVALAQAGDAAQGATAYVTLEPCAHTGYSGPCTEALIAAGVARVVAPLTDPDPRVSGQGFDALRAAGIEVVTDGPTDALAEINKGFLTRIKQNRPALTLKLASTLDGRIATASGESKWITGPDARRAVHAMRMRHDAVLVGAGTVRADDPDLTVRDMGADRQPFRLVASRNADIPMDASLVKTAREVPVALCHGPDLPDARRAALEAAGVGLIDCALAGRQIDVADMMSALGDSGFNRIFCEGGGALAASLLAADLVDDLVIFTAGRIIGAEGQPSVAALGISSLADAPAFTLKAVQRVGPDAMLHFSKP